ncbi:MAG: choice-of-anchor U domain-containing protein [Pseudomonadota bacterium]
MILPYGVVDFVLENCTPHETATVTLSYSAPLPAGTQYYKLKEGAWIHIPEAIINGNTIQFPIQDNGPLDLDPTEGVIHDPSGPTLTAGAVPLLGPLGLLLTPVLLGGLAAFGQVRRRQREAQAQAHSLQ